MNARSRLNNARGAIILSLALSVAAAHLAGAAQTSPRPDRASARRYGEAFLKAWGETVSGLLEFRAAALRPSPRATRLRGIREGVSRSIAALRDAAKSGDEQEFRDLTSARLDEIRSRLDDAISAVAQGRSDQLQEALLEVGFALEEMAAYMKAAGR